MEKTKLGSFITSRGTEFDKNAMLLIQESQSDYENLSSSAWLTHVEIARATCLESLRRNSKEIELGEGQPPNVTHERNGQSKKSRTFDQKATAERELLELQ